MIHVFRAVFWVAAAVVLVMALLPQPPEVPVSNDKVQHMLAFGTLAVLASAAYSSTSLVRLLAGLSAFGALIELLQAIPGLNRYSDPVDWLVDTVAAAVLLSIARLWRTERARWQQKQTPTFPPEGD